MATRISPTSNTAPPPEQAELVPAPYNEDDDDGDSAILDDAASSTASMSSSVLNYRTIQGRTFHSDRHPTEYFTPNDEQQRDSVDIAHHYLTLLLDGRLFLAPIGDNPQSILDIGTGTGIWAIDFADEFPNAEVIGSDLSPIQPEWVPPNVKFEIDDASMPWAWKGDSFDFVHIRYLSGAIMDWSSLLKEAYKVNKPGAWVQTCEFDAKFHSDDDTAAKDPTLATWAQLFGKGGEKMSRSFKVVEDDLQRKALEEAGYEDIQVVNYKLPIGEWPQDRKLAEIGRFTRLTMENDLEGYTLLLWNNVLGWPKDDYQIFLMGMRKVLRNRAIHGYMPVRYVYGRKPGNLTPADD